MLRHLKPGMNRQSTQVAGSVVGYHICDQTGGGPVGDELYVVQGFRMSASGARGRKQQACIDSKICIRLGLVQSCQGSACLPSPCGSSPQTEGMPFSRRMAPSIPVYRMLSLL